MFLQRLIMAIILIPVVLGVIFYAPSWLLLTIIILIIMAAAKECWLLIPLQQTWQQIVFLGLMLLAFVASTYLFTAWLYVGMLLWLLLCYFIVTFPKSQQYWGYPISVALMCLLIIPLFSQSLIHLYMLPRGKELLVYLLFLIWAADSGAYFMGKFIGKHKLIPQVSPGKSWEGVLGGVGLSLIVAGVGVLYFHPLKTTYWFLLALFITIIAVFGDLFISILKRRCHLKDTGALIPGHGGILDRLDSLIAALPFFYLGILTLG